MKKVTLVGIIVIILMFAIGIYFYQFLPDKLASHWNAQGQVNGYSSKAFALFFMPIITLALFLLLVFIPKIDPLKQNIRKFSSYYYGFILLFVFYMFYIYILTLVSNLGFVINFTQFLSPAMGVLFFCVGILIEKSKRNWTIGIRTPWTLSSDFVWKKTHNLGGKLFKISGVICFVGIVLPKYAFFLIIIPVIISAIVSFVYSYFVYRSENLLKKKR
ncbi:MAG: DUF1648 domain-containing protein [Candidatus Pacearchaeota archaeon]|jgi:uncharacterized membrane protein